MWFTSSLLLLLTVGGCRSVVAPEYAGDPEVVNFHGASPIGVSIAALDGRWAYMELRESMALPDPCDGSDIVLRDDAPIGRVKTCSSHDQIAFLENMSEPGRFTLMTTATQPEGAASKVRVTWLADPLDDASLVEPPFVGFSVSAGSRPSPCGDVEGNGFAGVCATSMIAAAPSPPEGDFAFLPPDVSWRTDLSTRGVAGDLDGDGLDELYIAHAGGLSRVDGLGPGTLDLATLPAWTPAGPIGALATADLDGDGRVVLLAGVGSALWVVEQGLASAWPLVDDVPASIASLAVGDFDGDGVDDVAIGAPPNVLVVGGDGRPRKWWSHSSSFGAALAAADIDLDGFDDLLVGHPSGGNGQGAIYKFDGPF